MSSRVFFIAAVVATGASCSEEVTGPTPTVNALTPSLVCGDQLTTEVLISGAALSPLAIDDATKDPKLAIPDVSLRRVQDLTGAATSDAAVALPNDPANPASGRVRWTSEMSMALDVYPELGLAAGLYEVTVTNRNGRSATLPRALAVVDEPQLTSIEPDLTCLEQDMRSFTIRGMGFLQVGTALPTATFTLAGTAYTFPISALSNCISVPGPTEAQLCTTAQVTLPADAVPNGAPSLVVKNPEPAGCDTRTSAVVTMAIVPRPMVTSAEPELFCSADGGKTITLTGSGFVVLREMGGAMFPTVTIGGQAVAVTAATGCTDITGTLRPAESCTTLTVDVGPTFTLTGDQPVVVTNPDPAGCQSEEPIEVLVLAAPNITSIQPQAVCSINQPTTMTVTGTGFFRMDNGAAGFTNPIVTVDGGVVSATFSNCQALVSDLADGLLCTTFTFPVPTGGFAIGPHTVLITNPADANCSDSETFTVAPTPRVTSVDPTKVCSDGGSITVTGTGFVNGSTILIDNIPITTTFSSSTTLVGTIATGTTAGFYDISVSNGVGCASNTLLDAVKVVDKPIVFFVDPPNIYSEIDMRISVFVSGIEGTSPQVLIRRTGNLMNPLIALANPAFDGDNKVFATVAASMNLAAGDYDVIVDDNPCDAELVNSLHVTDTLTVSLTDIDPSFGVSSIDPVLDSTVENTGVTLFSTVTAGFDNFEKQPRFYLTPVSGTTPATELKSVQWLNDPLRVNAVVPAALPAGDYRVLVINPDGGVGLLSPEVFTMLRNDDRPPLISGLDPGQVVAQTNRPVDILGSNFPTSLANVDVSAVCRHPSDATKLEVVLTEANSRVVVNTTAANVIRATWDMSNLQGYACVVRVRNLINNAFSDFSAITVTNSSGNLAPFFSSNRTMVETRRALSSASMRMNNVSRFLFAIGGDNGAATPVRRSSAEGAPVDAFGKISANFTLQRNQLPEERAFTSGAAAVIGRHVYIAGGRSGTGAGVVDNRVLRSYLLDPTEAPEIVDLDLDLAPGAPSGVQAGIWYYRVAAVMAVSDPNNPGGEGLSSEPLVIQIPTFTDPIHLTLYWRHIPGATGYRIYRTKMPNGTSGDEFLLATQPTVLSGGTPVATQSFTDTGLDNTAAAATPMPLGSLGTWHQVGTLNGAREGAGFVAVPDSVDPTSHYLYVIGGRGPTGTLLGSIEWAKVRATASNAQLVLNPINPLLLQTFVTSPTTLPSSGIPAKGPRWLLGAVYMDNKKSTAITGSDVIVYALPGIDSGANDAVNRTTALRIDVADGTADVDGIDGDGSISSVSEENTATSEFSGYGYVANHNFLQVMGGRNSAPASTGDETFMLTTVPDLDPWDAGTSLVEARWLCGTAYESAFVFLLGGNTSSPASNTVEQSNF